MQLEHFHDFYFLEALQAAATMAGSTNPDFEFRRSVIKFEEDVRDAFVHLTHEMGMRIWVYLWAAALGEARYARSHSLSVWIEELNGDSRQSVYHKSFDFFPCQENVDLLKKVYGQRGWGGAYGGKKWLEIVEGLDMYGKVSDATFIDHSVDLEHNGGCVFSKSAKFGLSCYNDNTGYSAGDLRFFLDFKFKENILEKTLKIHGDKKDIRISSKVYRLIERYKNIFLKVGSASYLKTLDVMSHLLPTMEWLDGYTVEWGTDLLTIGGKPKVKKIASAHKGNDGGKLHHAGRLLGERFNGKTIRIENEHTDKIILGKSYLVKYDGDAQGVGWCGLMRNYEGEIITVTEKNVKGYAMAHGFLWAKEWLYEVKPAVEETKSGKIEVGKSYLAKQGHRSNGVVWVSSMDKYHGTIVRIVEVADSGKSFKASNGWWFAEEWLHEIREERQERRHAHVSTCDKCGVRTDEENLSFSEITHNTYCQDCWDETFETCDRCGHEGMLGDFTNTNNHPSYYKLCNECLLKEMMLCEQCGEWHMHDDMTWLVDVQDYVCGYHAEGTYCRRCGENYEDLRWHNRHEHKREER
jgi:hypothetical protein